MYGSPSYSYSPLTSQGLMTLPVGYKEGGLAKMAQKVQAAGRYGDTMLAHITPEEAMMLKAMGGSGTINPETGLPEFFLKKILKAVAPILKIISPILPFLPIPGIGPMSSLLTKSLLTGLASGVDKEGNFDLKRGLTSGALTYGLGSLTQGAPDAANAAGTGGPYDISDAISVPDVGEDIAALGLEQVGALSAPTSAPTGIPTDTGAAMYGGEPSAVLNPAFAGDVGVPSATVGTGSPTSMMTSEAPISVAQGTPGAGASAPTQSTYESLMDIASETAKALKPDSFKDALKTAGYATTAVGGVMSLKERQELQEEEDRRKREMRAKREGDERFARGVLSEYQPEFRRTTAEDITRLQFAEGGIANLKAGGRPRFLTGQGDGMTDSIKAKIGGVQEARLSDGEFVIPADVVSHLGNGSSRAGAKKLYSMMDRVRKARTGKNKQAPAVKAERFMPV
jgi:hypothetical protein